MKPILKTMNLSQVREVGGNWEALFISDDDRGQRIVVPIDREDAPDLVPGLTYTFALIGETE